MPDLPDQLPLALTFDDVLIVPGYSEVHPAEVSLRTTLCAGITLNIPLVSAAMDTVTESRLAIALAQEGGIGVIHKNLSIQAQAAEVDRVKRSEAGMIVDPVTMRPDQSIRAALELMAHFKISGVPVTDDRGRLVGILTNRDLRWETELDRPIADLMTRENLVTVPEGTTLEQAKALLHKHKIEKLLVVDPQGNLRGLITVKDIQKMMQYPNACKDALGRLRAAAAVGASGDYLERAAALVAAKVDVLVVDSSHAHSKGVIDAVASIRDRFAETRILAGNVATADGARALVAAGADAVKVGIGPGSICTTRVVTGAGLPQVTAILDCVSLLRGARRAGGRRWWRQILGRRHQGDRRRRLLGDDRLALRRHRREPGRDHPLPGAHLQGVPGHGLAVGDGPRQRRPLLPGARRTRGQRLALQAGAGGDRGNGPLQG